MLEINPYHINKIYKNAYILTVLLNTLNILHKQQNIMYTGILLKTIMTKNLLISFVLLVTFFQSLIHNGKIANIFRHLLDASRSKIILVYYFIPSTIFYLETSISMNIYP